MGLFGGSSKKTDASTNVRVSESTRVGTVGVTGTDIYKLSKSIGAANVAALQQITYQEKSFLDAVTGLVRGPNAQSTIASAPMPLPLSSGGISPTMIAIVVVGLIGFLYFRSK